jgi:beta-N-acetylhexosaminidase
MSESPTPSGALLMIGLPGLELDDSTRELISTQGVNNFILFRRNVGDQHQLRRLCADLAVASMTATGFWPLIGIDQEGGSVTRLRDPWTVFPDQRQLAEGEAPEEALRDYAATCTRELLATGINLNLAPVLDVAPAGGEYFMERRALGGEAETVARLGCLVIEEMQRGGLAACGKHFPGLGSARLDPHREGFAIDKTRQALEAEDLPPFRAAIAAGVAALMTSHTVYPALDPERPATLSPAILTGLLRGELGFDGLLLTDDLEMGAIENEKTVAEAAVLAFNAGADLLLVCQSHDKAREVIAALDAARAGGRIDETRIGQARQRIDRVRRAFPVPL